jgi:hypothetical protein
MKVQLSDKSARLLLKISTASLALSLCFNVIQAHRILFALYEKDGIYRPGDRISVTGVPLKRSPRALVLFTASYCRFCVNNMPFYRRLVDASTQGGFSLIPVTEEDPSLNRNFLAAHGVAVNAVLSMREAHLDIQATPTLILIRRDGTILNVWQGELNEELQNVVLNTALAK